VGLRLQQAWLSCGDVSHRRGGHSHLQSACKRQADHGDGTDQHTDRDQPVPEFAHSWRIKGPPLGRTASPQQQKEKRSFLADFPSGHKRVRDPPVRHFRLDGIPRPGLSRQREARCAFSLLGPPSSRNFCILTNEQGSTAGPGRHRVEAQGVALPLRPLAGLAEVEEPRVRGGAARGGGGLG
jgi:hypothetical protein